MPDIEDIRTGRKTVDVTQIELELHEDVGLKEHEALGKSSVNYG